MGAHASPKFMLPRHSGETRTDAEGAKRRWRASSDLGGLAAAKGLLILNQAIAEEVVSGIALIYDGLNRIMSLEEEVGRGGV